MAQLLDNTARTRIRLLGEPQRITLSTQSPTGVQHHYEYQVDANVQWESRGVYVGTFVVDELGTWLVHWSFSGGELPDGQVEATVEVVPPALLV